MALFEVIIPGSMSVDASSSDQVLRNITFCFGLYSLYASFSDPNSGILSNQINRRGHQPGVICARSGNYFPGEHVTTDGQGRKVGKRFYTDGPAIIPDAPFPTFIVSAPSVAGEGSENSF